ncbi:2-hydroxyacid dehydrogenase [soil metagenome]
MTNRILVIGDSYMSSSVFERALDDGSLAGDSDVSTITIVDAPTWSTDGLREFEGDPAEVDALIDGHEVLALHAAPITRQVLERNPSVRMIAVARGGPVNVDLAAAKELGVTVTTTPGKNAQAVADLTIGFIIALLRNVLPSVRDVDDALAQGRGVAESTFEGARWFGYEMGARRLGLVGFGHVARLVAARAQALGMEVTAFDPFVDATTVPAGIRIVTDLDDLLANNEVISLHARASDENRHMMNADAFGRMPAGSFFVNTARESLADEQALLAALRSGHLTGAALDVFETDGPWRDLVALPQVLLTPHIAGATHETLRRGADMLVGEITAHLTGAELRWQA